MTELCTICKRRPAEVTFVDTDADRTIYGVCETCRERANDELRRELATLRLGRAAKKEEA